MRTGSWEDGKAQQMGDTVERHLCFKFQVARYEICRCAWRCFAASDDRANYSGHVERIIANSTQRYRLCDPESSLGEAARPTQREIIRRLGARYDESL